MTTTPGVDTPPDELLAIRRADLQALFDAAQAADEAGLLGKCKTDPCPDCTALEEAQSVLLDFNGTRSVAALVSAAREEGAKEERERIVKALEGPAQEWRAMNTVAPGIGRSSAAMSYEDAVRIARSGGVS